MYAYSRLLSRRVIPEYSFTEHFNRVLPPPRNAIVLTSKEGDVCLKARGSCIAAKMRKLHLFVVSI